MGQTEALASLKIDRGKRRPWPVWPFVLLALVAGAAVVLPPVLGQMQGVEVTVAPARKVLTLGEAGDPGAGSSELSAAGYVVADRQSVLAFKYTGRLSRLNVAESQRVKKGEVLAEIDHHELDAQIGQARASHREALAEVERLRTQVAQADAEAQSAKTPLATLDASIAEIRVDWAYTKERLAKEREVVDKDGMPLKSYEDQANALKVYEARIATAECRKEEVRKNVAVAESRLAAARMAVKVAETHAESAAAQVAVLEAMLKEYYIHSPFDGVVTEKEAEEGEIVAPISIGGSMARGSIATVAAWDSLQAEVDVAEAYIARVKPGGRAAIKVDAFAGKTFPGKVLRVLPRANRSKATVQVRVDFLTRDDGVLPEMGVRVRFLPDDAPAGAETGEAKEKTVVPKAALQSDGAEVFVWLVRDQKAVRRSVTVGEKNSHWVEIVHDLNPGDPVVVTGAENLRKDGQKVRTPQK